MKMRSSASSAHLLANVMQPTTKLFLLLERDNFCVVNSKLTKYILLNAACFDRIIWTALHTVRFSGVFAPRFFVIQNPINRLLFISQIISEFKCALLFKTATRALEKCIVISCWTAHCALNSSNNTLVRNGYKVVFITLQKTVLK